MRTQFLQNPRKSASLPCPFKGNRQEYVKHLFWEMTKGSQIMYDDVCFLSSCCFFHEWILFYRWDNQGLCVLFSLLFISWTDCILFYMRQPRSFLLFILDGLNFVVDEIPKVFAYCSTCYLFNWWREFCFTEETTKVFAYCFPCYLFHGWREFSPIGETVKVFLFSFCSRHLLHGWREFYFID